MATDKPAELRRLYLGFTSSRVILTANNLGIFDNLKEASSALEIAKKLKTDLRATRILLDALTGIGLVSKNKNSLYRNMPISSKYLVKNAPLYQGDIIKHASTMWQNFSGLDDVLKTGKPARRGFDHEAFIMGMHNLTILRTEALTKAIALKGIKNMLDLGGGPGTNAIAMAQKGIKATIFDMPETIRIAKKVVKKEGAKNIDFIAGDFHVDSIGSGYDLILVSQIAHAYSEKENIALLDKCRQSLNQGGRIAVQEFPINDNMTAPANSALFAVNMLVGTEKGRCYSPNEIKEWLRKTGFKNIEIKHLPETVLIIGIKK
ncbi:MAG: methyltransferase domain-containing protein [Nitrospirae bacterium]|nr:MAG: methyltransferase domain-containing protein [Nitrospirota bacterium]